jgi:tetratricopeptide (TPR) repeat protein
MAGHHAEAAEWYERGIELGNRHSLVRTQLGWVLLELGDFPRSRQLIDEGLANAADPLLQLDSLVAWHYFQGDYAGLAEVVRQYDERFADHIALPAFRGFSALLAGDAEAAIREYESLAGRDSERLHNYWDMFFGHWHALNLARARQLAGQHAAAEATLAEAERQLANYERQSGMPAMVAFYRGAIASLRGDQDTALQFLEQAREAGWRRHAQVRHGPLFTGLHGDERLDVLLAQVRQDIEGERLAGAP